MPSAYLPDRSLIRIAGTDAEEFLQALITTDVKAIPAQEARPGALLTPQGKILFDFLIWRDGDGFVIETDSGQRDAFVKRLTMYKLRAPVTIAALPDDGITVGWGEEPSDTGVVDGRFLKAGIPLERRTGQHGSGAEAEYHALRVAHGVVTSGDDYALQDIFPHDALLDLNGGLSFRKGCYVGQEVVSRMQHRGTARKRVVMVSANTVLPATGTELTAGGKPIGALGSVSGTSGLAIVRIDRAGEAINADTPILAGETVVTLALPAWSGLTFPVAAVEA
jgi:folate-binding protein YgfZ